MARRTLAQVFSVTPEGEPIADPAPMNGHVKTVPAVQPVYVAPPGQVKREVLDPMSGFRSSLRDLIPKTDLYWTLTKFRDRQQYGRIAYETAYKHEVVGTAFKARLALITSKKPTFKPRNRKPTTTQQDMADFANDLVESLHWGKFIEGYIGNGLEFGFSLAEIVTREGTWKGNDAILLDYLAVLPHATLDHGFVPRAEYSQVYYSRDNRYRCFDLDAKGRVEAYKQFDYSGTKENVIEWRGREMQKILHFVHGGGEGNPFGESALFHTMPAWLNLYAIERMEDAFLDTSQPWLFGTYTTQSGETRAKVHEGAKEALSKAHVDGARRFLMWADGDLKSVAPSNENFTDHIFRKKAELEARIWQTLLIPKSIIAETSTSDGDNRSLSQVYFRNTIKSDLEEIGDIVTDLVLRFLRWNFTNIQLEDVPVCTWSLVTENEMRVAQALLTALLPHTKSETLPDFVHSLFDFVDPKFIAETNEESVGTMRPSQEAILAKETAEAETSGQPPPKEQGESRVRLDGQTDNPSSQT
jgi:hypothetical protein